MKITTAKDVIAVARDRGFGLRINPGPPRMPVLVVPGDVKKSLATDCLMAALKAWRIEIMEELEKP